jgi:hypothetical protein
MCDDETGVSDNKNRLTRKKPNNNAHCPFKQNYFDFFFNKFLAKGDKIRIPQAILVSDWPIKKNLLL